MPLYRKGSTFPSRALIQSMVSSSSATGSSESVATRNILNGVLNCAWNKTSAAPKLLEIANGNQVKFNIDSDNPLVLAFANGWDDKDRPAQIVKRLATAPPNIDLSGKANCHVQIVAKVINDELLITTHDIFDPEVGYGSNVVPVFSSANPTNGWSVSASRTTSTAWRAFDNNGGTCWQTDSTSALEYLYVSLPFATALSAWRVKPYRDSTHTLEAQDMISLEWVAISNAVFVGIGVTSSLVPVDYFPAINFRMKQTGGTSTYRGIYTLELYELPIVKFFRSLNKVKDRSGNERQTR